MENGKVERNIFIMSRYALSYPTFLKKSGLTDIEAQELIAQSQDQVEFCERVSKKCGLELTLQQAESIYATAPFNK